MTLAPSDSYTVRGVAGPAYKVGPRCANPNCEKLAEHAHHIWRRSMLGGAYDWVGIPGPEGERIIGNLTGLCPRCHDAVTGTIGGHRAKIAFEHGAFHWALVTKEGQHVTGLLQPQPPTPESIPDPPGHAPESDACPFCGQSKRRRPLRPPGVGRRRKTWRVMVPDDGEDGAEILDTLVDDIGLTLGIDPVNSGRYYCILPALYFACQNKQTFVDNLKGIGG